MNDTSPMPAFVLIHGPMVGPLAWSLVAGELRRNKVDAVVPAVWEGSTTSAPYWEGHVVAVTRALRQMDRDQPLVLVGHSGAGPLLPAVGERTERRIAAYLFVDADVPEHDGLSRLDLFDSPEVARQLRGTAEDGFLFNPWRNEEVLRAVGIEDAGVRQRFVAELPNVPLAVYQEPLPVPADWPDAPCGYLGFAQSGAVYRRSIDRARRESWPCRELEGGHFHMLSDPAPVAHALLDLAKSLGAM